MIAIKVRNNQETLVILFLTKNSLKSENNPLNKIDPIVVIILYNNNINNKNTLINQFIKLLRTSLSLKPKITLLSVAWSSWVFSLISHPLFISFE
jgi:hypothetical protein